MRLIDADKLLEDAGLFEVQAFARGGGKSILHFAKAWLFEEVRKAPTVQPGPGWISVKDRLPEYNKEVLTYTPGMAMPIVVDAYDGYYGEDDDEWYEGWRYRGNHCENRSTHWMPLPEPPKEADHERL